MPGGHQNHAAVSARMHQPDLDVSNPRSLGRLKAVRLSCPKGRCSFRLQAIASSCMCSFGKQLFATSVLVLPAAAKVACGAFLAELRQTRRS